MRSVVICVVLAGCYNPSAATEVPCAANGRCPGVQVCDRSHAPPVCVDTLSPIDAAPDTPSEPLWTTPVQLAGLPTTGGIDDPTLTDDMLELYFNMSGDIYVTTRASGGVWQAPKPVAELNTPVEETTPDVSGDGLTMYFASSRLSMATPPITDLFIATRASRADPWGVPALVSDLSSPSGDASAAITADGLEVVTSSNRKDGVSYDLYISTRATKTGSWSPLVPIDAVNAPGVDDTSGFFTADGLTLYFDSKRDGNGNLYRVHRASRQASFGAPERIAELASPADDFDPWVSPDGHHMFFTSKRSGVPALYESTR